MLPLITQATLQAATNLDVLCDLLNRAWEERMLYTGGNRDTDPAWQIDLGHLPAFGGEHPGRSPAPVVSWDRARLLIMEGGAIDYSHGHGPLNPWRIAARDQYGQLPSA